MTNDVRFFFKADTGCAASTHAACETALTAHPAKMPRPGCENENCSELWTINVASRHPSAVLVNLNMLLIFNIIVIANGYVGNNTQSDSHTAMRPSHSHMSHVVTQLPSFRCELGFLCTLRESALHILCCTLVVLER